MFAFHMRKYLIFSPYLKLTQKACIRLRNEDDVREHNRKTERVFQPVSQPVSQLVSQLVGRSVSQ